VPLVPFFRVVAQLLQKLAVSEFSALQVGHCVAIVRLFFDRVRRVAPP
jgi:hypothetical protein